MERIIRGLTNASGPHFWLVIGPPQLEKTWFMDHLAAKLLAEPVEWATRRIDIRVYPEEERSNAALLLMDLSGLDRPVKIGTGGRIEAESCVSSRKLSSARESNRPFVC